MVKLTHDELSAVSGGAKKPNEPPIRLPPRDPFAPSDQLLQPEWPLGGRRGPLDNGHL